MPRCIQRLDWGLLLALALALFAAAPFLTRPGLPHKTDAELHVYRAAELRYILSQGVFYPRWAPDLYLGYGYPIFNYYAPLTYYLANGFGLLPGVDIVGGVKAVFVVGLVVASVGSYLLGRELFGPEAGVIAAASFIFAPYIVFIDPHARGDLAEHFAICLLPLTLYFFRRLMTGGRRGPQGGRAGGRWALLGSVLTLAALVFSHNLMGLVSGGMLLGYLVWQAATGTGRREAGWGLVAFALAAALVAFFWLPALVERGAVKLQVIGPGHFDFREHFLSLHELLAPSRLIDWGAAGPHFRHNLGLAQWVLAVPALAVLLRGNRRTLGYFAGAALGLIFLMLPVSTPIWRLVPGMPYLQFPWRLLGPTNLALAVCAASGVAVLPDRRWRARVVAGALVATLLLALPMLYPPLWPPHFGGTAPEDIIGWERRNLAYGTTSTGDFLPTQAALAPVHPADTLLASYSDSGPVDKINRATIPDGASVEIVEHGPLRDRFDVSTPEKFVMRLYTFHFPGWRAYVDGEEVEIEVAGPEGFITFWVPEGEHRVLVRFEETPVRKIGWAISALAAGGLIIAMVLVARPKQLSRPSYLVSRSAVWLGGGLALVVALKGLVIDPNGWLRYQSPPGQARAAQRNLRVNFGGRIELLGYDLPRRRVQTGGRLRVVLYWHALAPLDNNYQSFVHLAKPLNVAWSQEDHLNPGGLPTTQWPLDKYVWDEYDIRVPPDTPPGEYSLNVGLYLMSDGSRLKRYDEGGQVVGDSVVVATVEVAK